jgi:hypothetical protein
MTLSKKRGCLFIVNQLFSIYFKLNLITMCDQIIPTLNARLKADQQRYVPKRDMVTYRFFRGRLALMKDEFAAAEQDLDYAFAKCHRG